MTLKHLSLFTGFMGFDLAAEWAGWENVAFVESADYPRKLIKSKYPTKHIYKDIKKFNGTPYKKTIDVISGGFPCQPFSVSGQLKSTSDDRYLWPEMLRVITEIRPSWVVGENVANIASMVQSSSNILLETEDFICEETEMVLETIRGDFARIGYRVEFFIIPASAVGACHRRNRLWILAHCDDETTWSARKGNKKSATRASIKVKGRRPKQKAIRHRGHLDISRVLAGRPSQIAQDITGIPGKNDGFSSWFHQSFGLGNAIVPQVAYEIFHHINIIEDEQ